MQDLLLHLESADYTFLAGAIESPLNLTQDFMLRQKVDHFIQGGEKEADRQILVQQLEKEIRYLGSSDIAYLFRYVSGATPGVPFSEIIRDVARMLKVKLPGMSTETEALKHLVTEYATQQFSRLSAEEQQQLLEELGVDQDRAAAFLKKSAGVFALPLMIQAFGSIVIDGLIKRIIFGAIAKIIGQRLAMQLFNFIAGRFPWWLKWVGPLAWTTSIGWTAMDIQGPAYRKTIPVVLYLGLCSIRLEDQD